MCVLMYICNKPEYRKLLRVAGSERDQKGNHGGLTAILILLWAFAFCITSVEVSSDSLRIEFTSWEEGNTETKVVKWIGTSAYILSLMNVIIAAYWQKRNIVLHCTCTLTAATITILTLQAALNTKSDQSYAESIIIVFTASMLSIIIVSDLWVYYVVPAIVKWEFGRAGWCDGRTEGEKMNHESRLNGQVSFPIWRVFLILLLLALNISLFGPILILICGLVLCYLSLALARFICCKGGNGDNPGTEFLDAIYTSFFAPLRLNVESLWVYNHILLSSQALDGRIHVYVRVYYLPTGWWHFRAVESHMRNPINSDRLSKNKNHSFYFEYKGYIDSEGYPCGYGEWRDNHPFGEVLIGIWKNSLPCGPCISRVKGRIKAGTSGCTFDSRLICCVNLADGPLDQLQFAPKWRGPEATIEYILSSVESCVSGIFYEGFPFPTFYSLQSHLPHDKNTIGWQTKGLDDVCDVISMHIQEAHIHRNQERFTSGISIVPQQRIKEVLLFIPGFNSCLASASGMLGQFLALGGFPDNILPVVFQWPAGSVATYYQAKRIAESERFGRSLLQVIASLYSKGFTKIILMSHSMGSRGVSSMFTNFPHSPKVQDGGEMNFIIPENSNEVGKISIHAAIFLNPEADLIPFINNAYGIMKDEYNCNNITLYTDQADGAIYWAEKGNKLQWWYQKYEEVGTIPRSDINIQEYAEENENNRKGLGTSFASDRICMAASLGRAGKNALFLKDALMDIDVIDATGVHGNVQELRHSYFSLSREVIEDIREQIIAEKYRFGIYYIWFQILLMILIY